MINVQYKLITPLSIESYCENLDLEPNRILVKPKMLSICKADLRYYFGMRDAKVLKQRLPLTLIHEACGSVLYDKSGKFEVGEKVILLPNIPGEESDIEENYRLDSLFRSSRADGFMQEMVSLPDSQIVSYKDVDDELAAITEFVSVGVHAINSFMKKMKKTPKHIAVWGDGAMGYVVCSLLKHYLPSTKITIIGKHRNKLDMFQFVEEQMTIDEVGTEVRYDAAFECTGGRGTQYALSQVIDVLEPESVVMLLGVSEEPVPINTRMVLEKGLILYGRSRSTRQDFIDAVSIMGTDKRLARRLALLVSEVKMIRDINDIHHAFQESRIVDYKMVMDWRL